MAAFHKIGQTLRIVTGFNGKDPVSVGFTFEDGTPAIIEVSPKNDLTIKKTLPDGTTETVLVLRSE